LEFELYEAVRLLVYYELTSKIEELNHYLYRVNRLPLNTGVQNTRCFGWISYSRASTSK